MNSAVYDFIIVGSGASGSVCAETLSQNSNFSVALIEAGTIGNETPLIFDHMNWFQCAYAPDHGWGLLTTPQPHSNDRVYSPEVGKLLGGCCSHNAMFWVRGNHADFKSWEEKGCSGFGPDKMLEAYRSMERVVNTPQERFDTKYHGVEGYIKVQQAAHNEFVESVKKASEEHLRWIDDQNGATQLGMSYVWSNIDEEYKRHGAYHAFIHPNLNRPNLTLIKGAEAKKVIFDGTKAVGIEYVDKDGEVHQLRVRKEVILSCGALLSPKLLMLSGVGPESHLKSLDIPVVADLPVGKNLQDHTFIAFYYRAKKDLPPCKTWASVNGFWRSDGGVEEELTPDFQLLFASNQIGGLPLPPEVTNKVLKFY